MSSLEDMVSGFGWGSGRFGGPAAVAVRAARNCRLTLYGVLAEAAHFSRDRQRCARVLEEGYCAAFHGGMATLHGRLGLGLFSWPQKTRRV